MAQGTPALPTQPQPAPGSLLGRGGTGAPGVKGWPQPWCRTCSCLGTVQEAIPTGERVSEDKVLSTSASIYLLSRLDPDTF